MTYLLAYLLTSICACVLWFQLAQFTDDEETEMMTTSYTRRPLTVKVGAWFEAKYLAWRIKHAERDVRGLRSDREAAIESVDRLEHRIDAYEAHIELLTRRLSVAMWK